MAGKGQQGVTLFELLIVIALIAIILAFSVPSFSKIIERNRLKSAAESLKSDLQLARLASVKASDQVILTKTTGNNGAWCYGFNTGTTACDCTQTDTTQANYCSISIVSGTNFPNTNLDSSSANTTFNFRRGTANSSNACFSTTNYTVKVFNNNAGRVEICSDTTAPVGGYEVCATNCP